jgi:RNA polymerase sigma factor (sigma-70 family)
VQAEVTGKAQDRLVEWFHELRAPLRRFLGSRRGMAPADLDDVAQEVFLRLLRYRRADLVEQPKAYLFKVAANVAAEWGMKARHRWPHDADWLSELHTELTPDDELQRAQRDRDVGRALATLPTRMQAILQLQFGEGLTQEAIAAQLGVTRRVVKRDTIGAYARLRLLIAAAESPAGGVSNLDVERQR